MTRATLIGVFLTSWAWAATEAEPDEPPTQSLVSPSRKGHGKPASHDQEVCYSYTPEPLAYHGGPVLHGTLNVYLIFYGQWLDVTPVSILSNLVQSIGGSQYYAINTTYNDYSGQSVANSVRLAGTLVTGWYPHGASLGDGDVANIVRDAINYNGMPLDSNGLYMVIGDQYVTNSESGDFCIDYCGWHGNGTINNSDLKYAFIGDPRYCWSRGIQGCGCFNLSQSPNYHPAGDEMASVLTHEMMETHTDPDGNAWWSNVDGGENADECAYTYGTLSPAGNGSVYNITLGGRQYLLQRQEFRGAAVCGMSCADGGLAFCGGRCVNLANDLANCGPPGTQSCCGGDFCARTCPRQCP